MINDRIINNIIDININYRNTNLSLYNEFPHTFILVEGTVKVKINNSEEKTLSELKTLEDKTQQFPNRKSIDDYCLKIYRNQDLNEIKIDGNEDQTKILRQTISTYFLEGGSNLHLIEYKENYKLNDNYYYTTAINLITDDRETKINSIIQANTERQLFWMIANKPDTNNIQTKNVFYLECPPLENTEASQNKFRLHWLAHPAAYLNQLSLESPVKDYNYTQTFTINPPINQTVEFDSNRQWVKNYIVNIGGRGVCFGSELIDGKNLVNTYMLNLLERKIKSALVNVLISKPSRTQITSKIESSLLNILNNFYGIGALINGVYNDKNYEVLYNGESFTVVKSGELLDKGYKLHIVDILKATNEDIENHKMTPITILLMFQKQVRFLQLNMEVL